MKKTTIITLAIALFLSIGNEATNAQVKKLINNTQEVNNDLNDTEGFPMSASETKEFNKMNRDLTNNLDIINKSNKSDDDKDKAIDKLFDDRDKGVKKLFNNDQTRYEKFQKKTDKKLRKTKRKAKINLAKAVL